MTHDPVLSEHDPRLCPGDGEPWNPELEGERPEWASAEPFTVQHRWVGGGSIGAVSYERYCSWCEARESAVQARFSDWRYEQLAVGLTEALKALTRAVEASTRAFETRN